MPKGSQEKTAARRNEILDACERLYENQSFKDITIGAIADATSFGRTSIYNYFQTKEEIFLALLQREYESWTADLEKLADAHEPLTKEKFADALAQTLGDHQNLLRIMTMNHFEMEDNSSERRLVEFKKAYGASIDAVKACLARHCPQMDESDRKAFVYALFPFIYGIYPYTHVSGKQKEAMRLAGLSFEYLSVYELSVSFLRQLLGAEASGTED